MSPLVWRHDHDGAPCKPVTLMTSLDRFVCHAHGEVVSYETEPAIDYQAIGDVIGQPLATSTEILTEQAKRYDERIQAKAEQWAPAWSKALRMAGDLGHLTKHDAHHLAPGGFVPAPGELAANELGLREQLVDRSTQPDWDFVYTLLGKEANLVLAGTELVIDGGRITMVDRGRGRVTFAFGNEVTFDFASIARIEPVV